MIETTMKPVIEHVNAINSGQFTPGMKAGIVTAAREAADAKLYRASMRVPFAAVLIAAASLGYAIFH